MRVAVIGGKGGVGKSTVAYNLGARLDAVVVDADLGMADLPEARGPDLHDVLAGRATPEEAVREGGPVALLPCGRSLVGARAGDPTALVETVRTVADEYGRVVVDCPAGLNSDVGLSLLAAEACVVVTTPDRVALADALRERALARTLDAGLARVALNRATRTDQGTSETDTGTETGTGDWKAGDWKAGDWKAGDWKAGDASRVERAVERAFGAPVVAIPESPAVERATRHGQPVGAVAPESRAAERFADLAAGVQRSVRSRRS